MGVPGTSAWTFGASIMSFLFPEILFVLVACTLFILYTKPEMVPGHRVPRGIERPVSYTAFPPPPEAAAHRAATAAPEATAAPAATAVIERPAGEDSGAAGAADSGAAARTEDAE